MTSHTERELAQGFGVSSSVFREAVKVLASGQHLQMTYEDGVIGCALMV